MPKVPGPYRATLDLQSSERSLCSSPSSAPQPCSNSKPHNPYRWSSLQHLRFKRFLATQETHIVKSQEMLSTHTKPRHKPSKPGWTPASTYNTKEQTAFPETLSLLIPISPGLALGTELRLSFSPQPVLTPLPVCEPVRSQASICHPSNWEDVARGFRVGGIHNEMQPSLGCTVRTYFKERQTMDSAP